MRTVYSIWDKLSRAVMLLLLLAGIIGVAVWYAPKIEQNEQMRKQKLELDRRIAQEQEIARRLDAQIRSLQDPKTVERLARERLSYARPGETVIFFEAPPSGAPARR
jgi:cell division protein FtsB